MAGVIVISRRAKVKELIDDFALIAMFGEAHAVANDVIFLPQ